MGRITETFTASILMTTLLVTGSYAATADDYWPAWRGPRASGVAPTGKPPLTRSETENVKWRVPLQGEGTSSPIVWADKMFFLTAVKTDRLSEPAQIPASGGGTPVPFHGGQTANVIPSPIAAFGMVFCTSGFRGSALQAIELGRTGDQSGTDVIRWQANKGTPYVPSPVLYGDNLYVCSVNKAVVSSYQAKTGKANFAEQPLPEVGEIYASPVGAADRVYFVGREGTTQVIKDAATLEILATNKLDDKFDASPAIAGNQLFLKGKRNLYCVSE